MLSTFTFLVPWGRKRRKTQITIELNVDRIHGKSTNFERKKFSDIRIRIQNLENWIRIHILTIRNPCFSGTLEKVTCPVKFD